MSKTARIRKSFERAAVSYDASAFLQHEVARRLDERLEVMKIAPRRILDAGCGTGFAFPMLARRYADAELVGMDISYNMLLQARTRLRRKTLLARLDSLLGRRRDALDTLVCADMTRLPFGRDSQDMIWSNLAMQWVEDLAGLFRQLHDTLLPGGVFLFSTLGPDTLKELRAAFDPLDGYRHVNNFIDMHDIGDALMHAGFANPVMEMEYLTLTYSDLRSLFKDLKGIGAHAVLEGGRAGLMGKREWQALQSGYERFRKDGRLPATYEVIYGHAWAGRKDRLEDGRQVIQFRKRRADSG